MEELPIQPSGIFMQQDFITPEHEAALLTIFQTQLTWPDRKGRLALHYGHTFSYKTFGIDEATAYIPAFDQLYALSLGAPVSMQFRDGATGARTDVDLLPRSIMAMRGDARLHWTHGIRSRKTDPLPDGGARPREGRWSLTYRWLRPGAVCECGNEKLCDTAQRRLGIEKEYRWKDYEAQAKAEQEKASDSSKQTIEKNEQ
ncbi:Alkylated DNA repair protein alkB 8 like [Verticillium longisporum]|nr:Alkylated DNA repair protein alkB 8 like [Verticillium longisporum]